MLLLSFTFGISPHSSTFVMIYSVFSSGRISSKPYVEIERLALWRKRKSSPSSGRLENENLIISPILIFAYLSCCL